MLDGWDDGLLYDDAPWVGRTALFVGLMAAAAGAAVVGATVFTVDLLWRKATR